MVSSKQLGYDNNTSVRYGVYSNIMPKLVQQGFTVKTTADLMADRIASDVPGRAMAWRWETYFDTSDAIAGTKNEVIFDLSSRLLRNVTPKTQPTNGGIILPEGYNAEHVARSELGPLNQELTEEEARGSHGWFILAGKNEKLRNDYVTQAFKRVKDTYGKDKAMGLWVPEDGILRALFLWRQDGHSDADGGRRRLGDDDARLVGVRSVVGAQVSSTNLEATVRDLMGKHDVTEQEIARALEVYAKVRDTFK